MRQHPGRPVSQTPELRAANIADKAVPVPDAHPRLDHLQDEAPLRLEDRGRGFRRALARRCARTGYQHVAPRRQYPRFHPRNTSAMLTHLGPAFDGGYHFQRRPLAGNENAPCARGRAIEQDRGARADRPELDSSGNLRQQDGGEERKDLARASRAQCDCSGAAGAACCRWRYKASKFIGARNTGGNPARTAMSETVSRR